MTDWKQIDKWYLKLDDWTISKMKLANGTKYALWNGTKNCGYFDNVSDAKNKYDKIILSVGGDRASI